MELATEFILIGVVFLLTAGYMVWAVADGVHHTELKQQLDAAAQQPHTLHAPSSEAIE